MNTFKTLLEIKTAKKNLSMKAIYIKESVKKEKWTYYIYYYDKRNHSFYINGLKFNKLNINILEQVINKAYKQETSKKVLDTFVDIINQMQFNKKPKVFYFHKSQDRKFICIDNINLKAIRNQNIEIKELKIVSYS